MSSYKECKFYGIKMDTLIKKIKIEFIFLIK